MFNTLQQSSWTGLLLIWCDINVTKNVV